MQSDDLAGQSRPAGDHKQTVGPLAVRIKEAAEALSMSVDSFERYVEHEIKMLHLGSMKLVPMVELERFISENAYRVGGVW